MEILIYAAVVFMISVGVTDSGWLSPQSKYNAWIDSKEPPQCFPLSAQDLYAETKKAKGKVATFSLEGKYRCPTKIINYGERDSFYDFVVNHTPETTGPLLAQLKISPQYQQHMWVVRATNQINGDINQYLKNYFETILVNEFGPERVARVLDFAHLPPETQILQIDVIRTIDVQHLLRFTIKTRDPNNLKESLIWES